MEMGVTNNKDYNINPDIKTGILNPNLNPYQDQEVIREGLFDGVHRAAL